MSDAFENLANAIILQTVKDWRLVVRKLKEKPERAYYRRLKTEYEEFFLSDWFSELTSLNGETLLKKMKEEEKTDD